LNYLDPSYGKLAAYYDTIITDPDTNVKYKNSSNIKLDGCIKYISKMKEGQGFKKVQQALIDRYQ